MVKALTKHISVADVITLIGTVMGIAAIFLIFRGYFYYAMSLIVLAVFVDALDGAVARAVKRKGNFGVELDSLSDFLVFGVAVAIFGYGIGLANIPGIAVLTLFIVCGALRLARFNITKDITKGKYFEGTPIPLNAIIPVIAFAMAYMGISAQYLIPVYFVLSITMISSFHVKKFG